VKRECESGSFGAIGYGKEKKKIGKRKKTDACFGPSKLIE
jgi:hypothetical protein